MILIVYVILLRLSLSDVKIVITMTKRKSVREQTLFYRTAHKGTQCCALTLINVILLMNP